MALREWTSINALGHVDRRLRTWLDRGRGLRPVVDDCIAELRREREAVLARAAAGSEPWRPRPGR
jgi:hypothetical protein